jgi:hypothetical protein
LDAEDGGHELLGMSYFAALVTLCLLVHTDAVHVIEGIRAVRPLSRTHRSALRSRELGCPDTPPDPPPKEFVSNRQQNTVRFVTVMFAGNTVLLVE